MSIKEQIEKYYPELMFKSIDNEKGDWITDEGFLEILEQWHKYLKKNKEVMLRNIVQVWKLTQDFGYSVLQRDWEGMAWAKSDEKDAERYTIELAETTLMDKVHAVLGQLYNSKRYGEKGSRSKRFGATGLLIVGSMSIRIEQSDTRDMDDVIVQLGIDMQLYGGDHVEFKIEES